MKKISKSGISPWTKYEKTLISPASAARATIGGDLSNSSGKVWVDDLVFVKESYNINKKHNKRR